jgi:predicted TIM-barrel fold metal-dependent hydrolase
LIGMIVDVHTHVGEYPGHISEQFASEARAAWKDAKLGCSLDDHYRGALADVDVAVALAFNAPAAGFVVPNDYVAEYVARDPSRLVGFGAVDPSDPGAIDELERMKNDLGLVGCKLGPIYQNVDPLSRSFLRVCEALQRLDLPMLIHQGTTFSRAGSLLYAQPLLLDEIALRYPELKIVIAHVGHPWVDEAIAVVRRHPFVFTDVSALVTRPWQLYQAFVTAVEYRVEHKLLFGTDFPFFSARQTIEGLRAVTGNAFGAGMPVVDPQVVEDIINRPSLELLGIEVPATTARGG